MVIIQKEVTEEGETIPYQQSDLKLTTEMDGKNDKICMSLPVTIGHKIDEKSPFYDMKPSELLKSNFEVCRISHLDNEVRFLTKLTKLRGKYDL